MTTTPNPTAEQIESAMFQLFPITVRYDGDDVPNPGAADKREGFKAGIEYMRGLLSEGVPSEEQVERSARGVHALTQADTFEDYHPSHQDEMRKIATAALTAAGVTPPAPEDREKLIEAAEMHVAESRTTESGESILACGWCEDDWPCITSRLRAALAVSPAPLVLDEAKPRRRLRACVEAWPDCESGDYNPSCCRFPKSCSAGVYDLDRIQDEGLEPVDEDERGGAQ